MIMSSSRRDRSYSNKMPMKTREEKLVEGGVEWVVTDDINWKKSAEASVKGTVMASLDDDEFHHLNAGKPSEGDRRRSDERGMGSPDGRRRDNDGRQGRSEGESSPRKSRRGSSSPRKGRRDSSPRRSRSERDPSPRRRSSSSGHDSPRKSGSYSPTKSRSRSSPQRSESREGRGSPRKTSTERGGAPPAGVSSQYQSAHDHRSDRHSGQEHHSSARPRATSTKESPPPVPRQTSQAAQSSQNTEYSTPSTTVIVHAVPLAGNQGVNPSQPRCRWRDMPAEPEQTIPRGLQAASSGTQVIDLSACTPGDNWYDDTAPPLNDPRSQSTDARRASSAEQYRQLLAAGSSSAERGGEGRRMSDDAADGAARRRDYHHEPPPPVDRRQSSERRRSAEMPPRRGSLEEDQGAKHDPQQSSNEPGADAKGRSQAEKRVGFGRDWKKEVKARPVDTKVGAETEDKMRMMLFSMLPSGQDCFEKSKQLEQTTKKRMEAKSKEQKVIKKIVKQKPTKDEKPKPADNGSVAQANCERKTKHETDVAPIDKKEPKSSKVVHKPVAVIKGSKRRVSTDSKNSDNSKDKKRPRIDIRAEVMERDKNSNVTETDVAKEVPLTAIDNVSDKKSGVFYSMEKSAFLKDIAASELVVTKPQEIVVAAASEEKQEVPEKKRRGRPPRSDSTEGAQKEEKKGGRPKKIGKRSMSKNSIDDEVPMETDAHTMINGENAGEEGPPLIKREPLMGNGYGGEHDADGPPVLSPAHTPVLVKQEVKEEMSEGGDSDAGTTRSGRPKRRCVSKRLPTYVLNDDQFAGANSDDDPEFAGKKRGGRAPRASAQITTTADSGRVKRANMSKVEKAIRDKNVEVGKLHRKAWEESSESESDDSDAEDSGPRTNAGKHYVALDEVNADRAPDVLTGFHAKSTENIKHLIAEVVGVGVRSFGFTLHNEDIGTRIIPQKEIDKFRKFCKECGFSEENVVVRSSWPMNLNMEDYEQERMSSMMITEMFQCESLRLQKYIIRLGEQGNITADMYKKQIVTFTDHAHDFTDEAVIVLENRPMSSGVEGPLQEVINIMCDVQDKSRVGICLNIDHGIQAGHSFSSEGDFQELVENIDAVGFEFLKAVYIKKLEDVGEEFLILVLNDSRFETVPLILQSGSRTQEHLKKLHGEVLEPTDKVFTGHDCMTSE